MSPGTSLDPVQPYLQAVRSQAWPAPGFAVGVFVVYRMVRATSGSGALPIKRRLICRYLAYPAIMVVKPGFSVDSENDLEGLIIVDPEDFG